MFEEVLPSLFRIQVPLPRNPLKYVNSYLVKGNEETLIVDTGFNMDECYNTIVEALRELNVDLGKTAFLITHLHADHIGLIDRFTQSRILISSIETKYITETISHYWSEAYNYFKANGFPEDELRKALEHHSGGKYSTKRTDFQLVNDGETLNYGSYKFKIIHTPGHTPGHICLYEPERKLLISGDHILFDITPNISWWPILEDPLEEYLKSLDKTYKLDVVKTLPGHRSIGGNHRNRINELKEHHRMRLKETLTALNREAKTAWEIAPHISWDIKFKSWIEFPAIQKWFAVGEIIAHLIHLQRKGLVKSIEKNGKIMYSQA